MSFRRRCAPRHRHHAPRLPNCGDLSASTSMSSRSHRYMPPLLMVLTFASITRWRHSRRGIRLLLASSRKQVNMKPAASF